MGAFLGPEPRDGAFRNAVHVQGRPVAGGARVRLSFAWNPLKLVLRGRRGGGPGRGEGAFVFWVRWKLSFGVLSDDVRENRTVV